MFLRVFLFLTLFPFYSSVLAQEKFAVLKDLRSEWNTFEAGAYTPLEKMPFAGINTIYFQLDQQTYAGAFLRLTSSRPYYLFINGKIRGEFKGKSQFRIDSLLLSENARSSWIAIHQNKINERDLNTEIVSHQRLSQSEVPLGIRPYSTLRDFVVIAGLLIILLFLVVIRLNPKLAADYLSITKMFTSRDVDDSQASARLTGGSNVQFYILGSLLIGFYLFIVVTHLPPQYSLPVRFRAAGFWMMWLQWLKLSALVFLALLTKIFIIYCLTRLFDMRGMARFHFFNWIRLLLVVLGAATVLLFMYFISHGTAPGFYVTFLTVVIVVLIGWIFVAFFKLSGKSGHSMFHLFSYLCATEIIPLLITVKVLFQ